MTTREGAAREIAERQARQYAAGRSTIEYPLVADDRSRLARVASGFEKDEAMERLARLRGDDPDGWRAVPLETRVALGHYENARAAARALGSTKEAT